jgi:hypothetical protein
MIILLTSDARVKIVIVNPEILCDNNLAVSYEKVRISELLKGYLVSPMLDGGLILKDRNYLENHVREIIVSLIDHATLDSKASYEHSQDIKRLVILPLLEILRSESRELPNFDKDEDSMFGVDVDLFTDFFDNHYPQLKPYWRKIHGLQRKIKSSQIDEMLDQVISSKLDSHRIEHVPNEYAQRQSTDYIVIPIFRERLKKCFESDCDIDSQITRQDYDPFLISFRSETASVIYNPNVTIIADADKIVNKLRDTARSVLTDEKIMASLRENLQQNQKYNAEKRNLSKVLNNISHKPQLNTESGCQFVIP